MPPVVELDPIRTFDGMRRGRGNLRASELTIRKQEKLMWERILGYCQFQETVYQAESDPGTDRIGFGRPITLSPEEEEANLLKVRENVWLKNKLTELYTRVVDANPTAPLNEVLTSVLYYYQVETQKA